jgi:8-oxo-dGTP diphosphatase
MINNFKQYLMKESLSNFDLSKLVTIISINDNGDNWIYTTKQGRKFILPKEQVGKISLVDDKLANFVNSGKPITKYFETDTDGKTITYAANFAVDGVILEEGRVYLIERKDNRGWALPGGFIDAGETPEQAIVRELREETKLKQENIIKLESIGMVKTTDPREINFYTFPFLVSIKKSKELGYADDAKNSKWLLLGRAIKSKLAFSHHNEILKKVDF